MIEGRGESLELTAELKSSTPYRDLDQMRAEREHDRTRDDCYVVQEAATGIAEPLFAACEANDRLHRKRMNDYRTQSCSQTERQWNKNRGRTGRGHVERDCAFTGPCD